LGELNWVFTAITDTIAWNVLPRKQFQRLFRQDLLVASLFRNFLLADRIMRSINCMFTVSVPIENITFKKQKNTFLCFLTLQYSETYIFYFYFSYFRYPCFMA
jgi:hypothetical protein